MPHANINVSLFKSGTTPKPIGTVNLIDWLTLPNPARKLVDQIRTEPNEVKQKELKKLLPGVTVSGTFSYRATKDLIQYSGIMCIDIDFGKNEHITNYPDLKRELCKIKNVLYCSLSVRANGWFLLIPISKPEYHTAHFKALQTAFKKIGIEIDQSCSDVSRLRFYSYDTETYFNPDAITFTGLEFEQKTILHTPQPYTGVSSTNPLNIAVNIIEQSQKDGYWQALRKASYLLGGYIASGTISESEATHTLECAISQKDIKSFTDAQKTIRCCLRNGQQKPINVPSVKRLPVYKPQPIAENKDFATPPPPAAQPLVEVKAFKHPETSSVFQ